MEKGGGGNLEMGISRAKQLAEASHRLSPMAYSPQGVLQALRAVLHLMVHHIKYKPIQRQ